LDAFFPEKDRTAAGRVAQSPHRFAGVLRLGGRASRSTWTRSAAQWQAASQHFYLAHLDDAQRMFFGHRCFPSARLVRGNVVRPRCARSLL